MTCEPVPGTGQERPQPAMPYHNAVDRFRIAFLTHAPQAHRGDRSKTARTLGLQRTYLLKLIRTYQIDVPARGKNPNGTRDC